MHVRNVSGYWCINQGVTTLQDNKRTIAADGQSMELSIELIKAQLNKELIIDGATRWQIFTKITIPLSKPTIVYTVLTSFIGPWIDFIFAKVICRANAEQYTVSVGLWRMLEKEYIDIWYTRFAAGAVLISIPIAALFMFMQKYYAEGMSGSVKG